MPAFTGAFGLALLGGGAGLVRADRRTASWPRALPRRPRRWSAAGWASPSPCWPRAPPWSPALSSSTSAPAPTVLSRLHADAAGSALYTLLVAAFAPNAALLGSAYLLGPGFAVGTGTVVSPTAVVLGPLPAFPLLAALPAPGPGPAWATGFVAVPVLLAAVVGALTVRRHPTTAYETGALRGLGAGVVGGVLLTVLVHLAGGAAGPGRMADVGAPFLDTLAAAVVALGIGGLLGGVLPPGGLRRTAARGRGRLQTRPPRTPSGSDAVASRYSVRRARTPPRRARPSGPPGRARLGHRQQPPGAARRRPPTRRTAPRWSRWAPTGTGIEGLARAERAGPADLRPPGQGLRDPRGLGRRAHRVVPRAPRPTWWSRPAS